MRFRGGWRNRRRARRSFTRPATPARRRAARTGRCRRDRRARDRRSRARRDEIDLVVLGPETAIAAGVGRPFARCRDRGVRPEPLGRPARIEQDLRQALHGAPRHPDGALRRRAFARAGATRRSMSGRAAWSSKPTDWPPARASSCADDVDGAQARAARLVRERGDPGRRHRRRARGAAERPRGLACSRSADGRAMVPIAAACDYKRAGDGDTGPNTGGMGAYSPPAGFPRRTARRSCASGSSAPTLRGLLAEGEEYRGVLYCGLMWTEGGPRGHRVQRAFRRSRNASADAARHRRFRALSRVGGRRRGRNRRRRVSRTKLASA